MLHDLKFEKKSDDDAWIVVPTPGYVLKFSEAHRVGRSEKSKCFINVCYCSQLPPPTDDLDEDQLAEKIDKGDYTHRIPICMGELDSITDKKGDLSMKVDILVNEIFYEKRLLPREAQFFRHFFCMIMAEALENKHNIIVNPNDVKMLNRKVMGEISTMTIYKRPTAPVVHEISNQESSATENSQSESLINISQPKNISIRLLNGEKIEFKLNLQNLEPPVTSSKRLKLSIGQDRILLLLDNQRSLFDFCIPYNVDASKARSKFLREKNILVISAPIVFS